MGGIGEGGTAELTLKDMDSAKPVYKRSYNVTMIIYMVPLYIYYHVGGKQNLHIVAVHVYRSPPPHIHIFINCTQASL